MSNQKKQLQAKVIFENRFSIVLFAARSSTFSIKDVQEAVIDIDRQSVRRCLVDLMDLNLLERVSIKTYKATEKAKQLFGVTA
jgi:predicted transcriptional regulator of viral defense system